MKLEARELADVDNLLEMVECLMGNFAQRDVLKDDRKLIPWKGMELTLGSARERLRNVQRTLQNAETLQSTFHNTSHTSTPQSQNVGSTPVSSMTTVARVAEKNIETEQLAQTAPISPQGEPERITKEKPFLSSQSGDSVKVSPVNQALTPEILAEVNKPVIKPSHQADITKRGVDDLRAESLKPASGLVAEKSSSQPVRTFGNSLAGRIQMAPTPTEIASRVGRTRELGNAALAGNSAESKSE